MNEPTKKLPGEWAKAGDPYDCSGFIGPMQPPREPPEWPMYSYDRPSYILWNAIASQLHANGWNDTEIRDWLQSKSTRWALDGKLGDLLREIGTLYAYQCEKVR